MVIAVDPGSEQSGIAVIWLENEAVVYLEGFNLENTLIVDKVSKYSNTCAVSVIIEDIVPYRQKVSNQVISTCKFIGELNYRLTSELPVEITYAGRGAVKKWIYEAFPGLCVSRIHQRIRYLDDYGEKNEGKRYRNKDGDLRKPSFHWVDDRVVIAAMKELWGIPTPKPGKKNKYGFSSHSWQALALGSYFLNSKISSFNFTIAESLRC